MNRNGHLARRTDFRDETVSLGEIAGKEGIIEGVKFVNCSIEGPAVIVVDGHLDLLGNELNGDPKALLWEVPEDRPRVIGAILVKDSVFEKCRFSNVGFAGRRELLDEIESGLQVVPA